MRTLPQRAPIRLIRQVIERAGANDVGTLSAALTYQTLLSLIPVVLLAASIVGFVFADQPERAAHWIDTIAGAIPGLEEAIGKNIDALVDARLQAGVIAVAALAWTGSAMAGTGSHALARIFSLPERRWYLKRIRSLLELLVLGAAALAAMVLTSLLPAGTGPVLGLVGLLAGLAVDVAVFLLVYLLLTPPGGPSARGHLPGAIIGLVAIVSLASRAFLYGAEFSAVRGLSRPTAATTARS
jgi:membrane protein